MSLTTLYSARETEADKTTTYQNEWATVDPTKRTKSDVGFTPQRKPSRNTNFEREWTVRDEVIRPSQAEM